MDAAGLTLNKCVKIENRRLRTVYRAMMVLTSGSLIFKFLFNEEYHKVVPLKFVRPWLWIDPTHGNADGTKSLWVTNCSLPKTQLDVIPQCVFPCPHSQRNCYHRWALYTQESDNAVLFHTRTRAWRANSNNSAGAVPSDVLYPFVTNSKVSFGYAYKGDDNKISSSTSDVRTKLRKNGQEVGTFEPSGHMSFNISELLDLAGHPGIVHGANGANTGIELQLTLTCDVQFDASVCTLDVDLTPQQWVFSTKVRMLENGTLEHHIDYGIRVSVKAVGTYSAVDLEKAWASIVAALVF